MVVEEAAEGGRWKEIETVATVNAVEALEEASVRLGWEAEYRQLGTGRLEAAIAMGEAADLGLHLEWASKRLDITCATPVDHRVVLINPGAAPLYINGQVVLGNRVFVSELGQHWDVVSNAGSAGLTVILPDAAEALRDGGALGTVRVLDVARAARWVKAAMGQLSGRPIAHEREWGDEFARLVAGAAPGFDPGAERPCWERMIQARAWIDNHLLEPFPMCALHDALDVSASTLLRCFHETLGLTPQQYVTERRLDAARRRLRVNCESGSDASISRVALDCGFSHLGRFSRAFRQHFGILPSEFRARASLSAAAAQVTEFG